MFITNESIFEVLGDKIKAARLAKSYTQEELAELANLSTDQIRCLENGRSVGSVPAILNICNILEITPNDLFCELLDKKDYIKNNQLYKQIESLNLKDKKTIEILLNHLNYDK